MISRTTPISRMNEQRPRPTLWTLAVAFCWIALASFGGGLSAWSREVVVAERRWLSDEEFLSAMTLCRVLPGANQVNFAIYVGTRMHGFAGAVAAVLGLVTVPVLIVIGLAVLYFRYRTVPALDAVLSGITPVAVGMTFAMAWRTGRKALRGAPALGFFAAAFVQTAVFRWPLPAMLALLAPPAMWLAWPKREQAA
jgi:chromate transporter